MINNRYRGGHFSPPDNTDHLFTDLYESRIRQTAREIDSMLKVSGGPLNKISYCTMFAIHKSFNVDQQIAFFNTVTSHNHYSYRNGKLFMGHGYTALDAEYIPSPTTTITQDNLFSAICRRTDPGNLIYIHTFADELGLQCKLYVDGRYSDFYLVDGSPGINLENAFAVDGVAGKYGDNRADYKLALDMKRNVEKTSPIAFAWAPTMEGFVQYERQYRRLFGEISDPPYRYVDQKGLPHRYK